MKHTDARMQSIRRISPEPVFVCLIDNRLRYPMATGSFCKRAPKFQRISVAQRAALVMREKFPRPCKYKH